jgi:hypothetical protein
MGNKDTSMNVKALILGIVVSAGISTVWADASPEGCEHSDGRAHGCTVVSAPEIHAAAGVNALALLAGVLVLVAERRRRSSSNY